MEYKALGKTGLKISRLGLGGIPIQRTTPEGARNLVLELVKEDVNFIDTARGAISVSVLASKLADTLSLDYQQVFSLFTSSKILHASVTFFKVALCASLPRAKARGAICVSVLASLLADTLSLDYQRSSHPTQYPAEILDIAQDFHLVLRLWIATFCPKSASSMRK
ncbi:MAG: hypothetical protein J6Q85_02100 [Clostridia bacterium]|nr:hypothetical protein [Clostridia bacterium]